MVPPFRIAYLDPEQMRAVESLENDLGLALIAWEPASGEGSDAREEGDREEDQVLDALVDTYRTHDPHAVGRL